MLVLVLVRQHEEQSAGGGFLVLGVVVSKCRWLHIIVGISAQGNDVCVGGCKST